MSRFRGTTGIAIIALGALVAAFLLNALLHSFVPHSHEGSEAKWQELHAAISPTKKVVTIAVVVMIIAASVVVSVSIFHTEPVLALQRYTYRGIARDRRFT